MKTIRSPLTLAVLAASLGLLGYLVTVLVGGRIEILYGEAPGLATARNVAQIAAVIAAASLFVAGAIVAVPTALQPAGWLRKLSLAFPLYLLALTLLAAVSSFLGIGTVEILRQARA